MSAWQERAKKVWSQGFPGTNSKRSTQYPKNAPDFLSRASGPYVWDINGKRYIDFVGALGTIILGYNHPKVNDAVVNQLYTGYVSGTFPHPIEIECAEMIQSLFPACEKIRFFKNGDDATRAAVRIARAHTDQSYVMSENYHGSSDLWTSLTPPALGVKETFHIGHFKKDSWLSKGSEACYIDEPIVFDPSETRKEEITSRLNYCQEKGTVVIFDEIITGCRVPKLSVHKWWNLKPDLVCLGKAIANGFPLSVVGGKKEIMDSKEYFLSTTFSSEAVSLAACKATLTELKLKNMEDLWFYANRFQTRFNELCKSIGVEIKGYGTRGSMDLTKPEVALFCQESLKAGILFGKAFFFNFSHMEASFDEYLFNILSDIVRKIELKQVSLEGELPKQPFVR